MPLPAAGRHDRIRGARWLSPQVSRRGWRIGGHTGGVEITGPGDVASALDAQGYLADEGVATAAYLALTMRRPLFVEGDAGVGKTALAQALAGVLDAPLIRLQCYEGIDAAQALYDWDFPRQLLHLRAVEAAARAGGDTAADADRLEGELYSRRFLLARPL